MGIIDRLLGREEDQQQTQSQRTATTTAPPMASQQNRGGDPDAQAIERYRYMLKTAPPDAIEQAHAEAFAQLTPEQRQRVLEEMSRNVSPGEQPQADDPQSLARAATRAEFRQPGFMERTFGGVGMGGGAMAAGPGLGAMIGGSLLSSIAGSFIGSSIAHTFFDNNGGDGAGPDVVNNYYGNDANNELNRGDDPSAFSGADAQGEGGRDSDTEGQFAGDTDLLADSGDLGGMDDLGGGDF